ncbi:MAG TPA: MBL fold metallo-hydrolase [Flavobacteriaceae bacterium]|nr:MBL fold metallo-hydrolase [Flavobacteriaceae bacterium]
MQSIKIHFLGAAQTVTGSKYLIETPEKNIMIDCGVFQGPEEIQKKNWTKLPIDESTIDTVLLTHGHLDHTGYLPRLVRHGFSGDIIGTAPTLAIAKIIVLDSGRIHEEEAKRANKEIPKWQKPIKPFYTEKDAKRTLGFFNVKDPDLWFRLSENIKYRFRYNGHIIGATYIELDIFGKRFVFSGDIGRENDFLLYPAKGPKQADYLFMESTYGDRLHTAENVSEKLRNSIKQTVQSRGNLIIPSFAVERSQKLMFLLSELRKNNQAFNIPIFIDSPMGNSVLKVYEDFPEWHRLTRKEFRMMGNRMDIITSYRQTRKTIHIPGPKVIIAGSGMVSGGRVLNYLTHLIDKSNTAILLAGYQAEDTLGRALLEGIKEVELYGNYHPVRAKIDRIENLSAHADQQELMNWTSRIKNTPKETFLVHGEFSAQKVLKEKLNDKYDWKVTIPELDSVKEIDI